jgi:tetratricopeptide (TPR) repeat protein
MKHPAIRLLIPAGIAVVLFFGCGRKPGEKLYQEALTEWDAGNLVRARTLLEKSIRRRTGSLENAEAYNRLGLLLWETGDPAGAIDAFTESGRIRPGQFDVLCNLGVALAAGNDIGNAERILREASLLRPDDPRPSAYTGILYTRAGNQEAAVRTLSRSLQRTPNDPHLQNALALAELQQTGPNVALKRLQALAAQNPGYAPALFNIASIQLDWKQQPDEAARWFSRYLAVEKKDTPMAQTARLRLQAIAEGRENGTAVSSRPGDRAAAEKQFNKALAAHKAGKLNDAVKGYRQAIETDGTYEQAWYNLGLIYYGRNDLKQADNAFTRAVELNPAFIAARYNCALVSFREGGTNRALREIGIILSQQPGYQPAIDLRNRINR